MTPHWQTLSFEEFSPELLYAVMRLRQEVFIVEQDCPYLDTDGKDQAGLHVLGLRDDTLIAYQRCLPPGVSYPQESSIGRIVVDPSARGEQLGRELVRRGIELNRRQWPEADICISAQAHLQAFYGSLGFVSEGDEYMEDNIPHCKMRLRAG